jgi:hypothetical protein
MPFYIMICPDCGDSKEKFCSFESRDPEPCEECGSIMVNKPSATRKEVDRRVHRAIKGKLGHPSHTDNVTMEGFTGFGPANQGGEYDN